ncbi:MAG: MerR family transcriptional regulator [Candidatus Nanopelagicales bacterium]|nr:MerR family transcriptional regulator [Candidatus Nanopelagicales bacterium]MDZ4250032.1 MerR family transcriptional regulator [Candidatus Nanopelagicales bacterium]
MSASPISVATGSTGTGSIGAVLAELMRDFPDVSISKIRFLESEGLVAPNRARNGYRRFTSADVARLRLILTAQRDHYLPLRVIKDKLSDGTLAEALNQPAPVQASPPAETAKRADPSNPGPDRVFDSIPAGPLNRWDVQRLSGLSSNDLEILEKAHIVAPDRSGRFDPTTVHVCRASKTLSALGFDDRHIRSMKAAAAREAGLVVNAVAPFTGDRARTRDAATAMVEAFTEMHRCLLAAGLASLR